MEEARAPRIPQGQAVVGSGSGRALGHRPRHAGRPTADGDRTPGPATVHPAAPPGWPVRAEGQGALGRHAGGRAATAVGRGEGRTPPMRLRQQGTIEELLPAPPEAVWAVLTDPTRIGEWSSECRTGRWLDDAREPVVGARFTGSNKVRWMRWSRACRILDVDRPRQYVFETISRSDSSRWTYQLEPVGVATRVRQSFDVRHMWRVLEVLVTRLVPEHLDRTDSLRADLIRLGQVAARTSTLHASSNRPIDVG
ncbi:MAG: hypothetical protein GEV10_29325 [Streptosporangiales bacterium]|nr:hypothetical protein [Streptosporangiales bacterium]